MAKAGRTGSLSIASVATDTAPATITASPRTPKRVAVVPAYNEEAAVVSVLERLQPLADELIIVDDGSTDKTRFLVMSWAADHPNVRLICFNDNRGMSAAYYRAFQEVARRVDSHDLSTDDIILTVDADGQHDPAEVEALVDHMRERELDAVIARRDLSTYTLYKRLGNFLMSLWASFWAGSRLYDVESGYRAFRAGALLTCLRYYKGYRYSETVEIAVILARLGYRVDNNYLVPVPIFRSRTRLKDVVIDIAAIPAAAWRLEAKRFAPAGFKGSLVYYLPLLVPAFLTAMCISVLIHGLFLANDSMQHYSHVWYISSQLFHHGRLPLHFAGLDGGRAMTLPYAMVPYLVNAALYPVFGDWSVTLLMVVGVVATAWAAGLARPVLRSPWMLLFFVANPFFIDSLYSFQFASVWSSAFFFLFVWAFERRQATPAAALLWLCLTSHPATGFAAVIAYGIAMVLTDRGRLRSYGLSAILATAAAVPAITMTLSTPALRENSAIALALSIADSVIRRGSIVVLPLLVPHVERYIRAHYRRAVSVFGALTLIGLVFSMGLVRMGDLNRGSYVGVVQGSHNIYRDFFASDSFVQGAVYRVMEPTEREDGMYRFLRQGAATGNEFLGESYQRRNWSEAQFACYGAFKRLNFDVIESAYDRRNHKDESQLLAGLVVNGKASIAYHDSADRFTVYDLSPLVKSTPRPQNLRQCDL